MKIQALALGAALGFFAAIAPSCGTPQCSAASCDGCCGKDGKCVAKPNNTNNTTCGTSGNTCADCSATGTACDSITFACGTSGTGGGSAGGAGGGTAGGAAGCDGCKIANGTCQPRGSTRQNSNICGSNGETCKACASPTSVCDNGVCVAPAKKVGDTCLADVDCQGSLGPTAKCKSSTLAGNATYPGGMCTIEGCGAAGTDDCPMGSSCLNLPRIFGEERTACFANNCGASNTQGTCRSGYVCLGSGTTFCLPLNMVDQNSTPDTAATIGDPCTFNSDCRAPAPGAPGAGGACLPEVQRRADGGIVLQRDGGPTYTGNPGGQCTRDCRIDEDCTSDATENFAEGLCLGVSQTQALCFKGCSAPLGGQASCRPDYVCEQLTQSDGGPLPTGVCEARCDRLGQGCGNYTDGGARVCFPNGYCDFPGRQDAGPPPPPVDAGVADAGTPDAGDVDAGSTGGGAAGGGAAGGGSAAGGSAGGGSAGGGAAGGGSAAGGSAGGGSATTCPDGGALLADGGC